MAVPPSSPQPRRVATPSWLDLRLVLGVALVLASVLIGAKVVSAARNTDPTVTATRDLAAGTILTAGDLSLARVQLPNRGTGVYVATVHAAVGKRLNRDVAHGELLPVRALAALRPQTTLTVPLAAGAAPQLRAGQRVEVWVSTATCQSVVLLSDVTVQSVRGDSSGSFGSGTGGQDVVISVDPPVADRVINALALDQAKLRAGVLLGASTTGPSGAPAGSPVASPSGSSALGAGSGDLAACASPTPTPTPTR